MSDMAETIHLTLKANGNQLAGESSQHDLGRDKTIECLEFKDRVRTARELGPRAPVGRRVHETLEIVDRAYILHDGKVLMSGTTDEVVRDENVRRVYLGENFRIV